MQSVMGSIGGEVSNPLAGQVETLQRELKSAKLQAFANQRTSIAASYDVAQTSDANQRYYAAADCLSATAANSSPVREILRKRTRYEISNNSSLEGIVSTLANDVIGTNIRLRLTGMPENVARVVETEYMKWAKKAGISRKLRLMRREKCIDGEAFARIGRNPRLSHPVKLCLNTIEADRVTNPSSIETERWDGGWNVDGVLLDRYGNPTAYEILIDHPGAMQMTSTLFDVETVAATWMIHWYSPTRSGQYRGIPEVTSSLADFGLRRGYKQSVTDAARNIAHMGIIFETQEAPDPSQMASIPDGMKQDIQRNMATFAPEGYTAQQLKAEQPTSAFENFDRRLLNDAARCLNMPLNIAAADSSSYNYASGRLDHQVYWRSQDVERSELEDVVLEHLFELWVFEAVRIEGFLPIEARLLDTDWSHEWHYDGRQHVDPQKEAAAQKLRLENGTTTLAIEDAASGQDWKEMMDQQASENEYAASRGLPLPYPGGSANAETEGEDANEANTQAAMPSN